MPILEELGQVDATDDGRYVAGRGTRSQRQRPTPSGDPAPAEKVGVAASDSSGRPAPEPVAGSEGAGRAGPEKMTESDDAEGTAPDAHASSGT
jgi:hypothetical protein